MQRLNEKKMILLGDILDILDSLSDIVIWLDEEEEEP